MRRAYIRFMWVRRRHVLSDDCWCRPWKIKVDG
jgi:hypothetical protein